MLQVLVQLSYQTFMILLTDFTAACLHYFLLFAHTINCYRIEPLLTLSFYSNNTSFSAVSRV